MWTNRWKKPNVCSKEINFGIYLFLIEGILSNLLMAQTFPPRLLLHRDITSPNKLTAFIMGSISTLSSLWGVYPLRHGDLQYLLGRLPICDEPKMQYHALRPKIRDSFLSWPLLKIPHHLHFFSHLCRWVVIVNDYCESVTNIDGWPSITLGISVGYQFCSRVLTGIVAGDLPIF